MQAGGLRRKLGTVTAFGVSELSVPTRETSQHPFKAIEKGTIDGSTSLKHCLYPFSNGKAPDLQDELVVGHDSSGSAPLKYCLYSFSTGKAQEPQDELGCGGDKTESTTPEQALYEVEAEAEKPNDKHEEGCPETDGRQANDDSEIMSPPPPLRAGQARIQRPSRPGAFPVVSRNRWAPTAAHPPLSDVPTDTKEKPPIENDTVAPAAQLNPIQAILSSGQDHPQDASSSESEARATGGEEQGVILVVEASPDEAQTHPYGRHVLLCFMVLVLAGVVVALSMGLACAFSMAISEPDELDLEGSLNESTPKLNGGMPKEFWNNRMKWIKDKGHIECSYKLIRGFCRKTRKLELCMTGVLPDARH